MEAHFKAARIDFDRCIATPDIDADRWSSCKSAHVTLMPNPKGSGTVTMDIKEAVEDLPKAVRFRFKAEKGGVCSWHRQNCP